MQIVKKKNKRKAISPVLATVILIAITLIAAIAVAGFVFGLFGSFTSTAQLTTNNVSCKLLANPGALACTMYVSNTGSGTAGIQSCSINFNGVGQAGSMGTLTSVLGNTAPQAATCTTTVATFIAGGFSGSTATGDIVTNSATLPFSGVWS